jgi:hypothetical protein
LDDLELMNLWCSLPPELRKEKNLVKRLVDHLGKEMNVDVPFFPRGSSIAAPKGVVSFILKHKIIAKLVSIPYYRRRKREQYHEHPQAYFGVIPWKRYCKEFTGRESINYFHAVCFLERLKNRCERRHPVLDRETRTAIGPSNAGRAEVTAVSSLQSQDLRAHERAIVESRGVMAKLPLVEESGNA